MAMRCSLCGKGPGFGNVVSHANNTRRRRWNPNLQRVRAVVEGVWAVVNGKDVTRAQVDKYYRTQLNPDAPEPSQDEALSLKLNILDELMNNQILLERAKKLGLEAADGEVEDKFTEFKSPYTE